MVQVVEVANSSDRKRQRERRRRCRPSIGIRSRLVWAYLICGVSSTMTSFCDIFCPLLSLFNVEVVIPEDPSNHQDAFVWQPDDALTVGQISALFSHTINWSSLA